MPRPKGYILLVVVVLMAALLTYSTALIKTTVSAAQTERKIDFKFMASNIAEAGIEKALWCLNQTSGVNCGGTYGSSFAGESNAIFGGGIYDTVITAIDNNTKQIESAGYYPGKTNPLGKTTIKTRASTVTDKASFNYGIQLGQGGFEMEENSTINGSIYAQGTIEGDNGATITGDAYVAAGAALVPDQQSADYNADFIFGKTDPQIDLAQSFTPSVTEFLNKISLYIKRTPDAPGSIYIKIADDNNDSPGSTILASATLSASLVSTSYGWVDAAFNNPPFLTGNTKYWIILDASQNSTKYWTVGADAFNNYAGGTMFYSRGWQSYPWNTSGKDINFKTWSGGVTSEITDITVNGNVFAQKAADIIVGKNLTASIISGATVAGDAWADSISGSAIGKNATSTSVSDSTIGRNLWCQTKTGTTVGWNTYCPFSVTPPTPPGPLNMPISDSLIQGWKDDAAADGAPLEGNQTINQDASLGPKQINGNLTVGNGTTLTITGTIYVTGDILFDNNSTIKLDNSYGSSSGVIIADGNINMDNGSVFSGAEEGSYLLLVSTKNDTINAALDINNANVAAITYAPYGIIDIHNNAALVEMCAWKIHANNKVAINYESGLSEVLFSSGPAGGWSELKGYWQIIE